jgi:acetyl-CoA carboxylase carboxyltransferase component
MSGTDSSSDSLESVAWPTGEFGGMNIEGAVRLGWARELDAITDPDAREREYRALVDGQYAQGGALNIATHFEIDDVIDPEESRMWITSLLTDRDHRSRRRKKRPYIDTL